MNVLVFLLVFLFSCTKTFVFSFLGSSNIARCEYEAFKLGSTIADIFNMPIGKQDWNHRLHQDYIVQNLGFAPWISNGVHGFNGKTLTGSNAKDLHESHGWINTNITNSPYRILNHKWIYMYGDSTTRQVWASYAAPFQGNSFERNAKEWTRHYCNKQDHRVRHPKGGVFPEEGWKGPCGVNEVTCHVSGYGDEGLLTFDWKHFPYEDYDDYLFGNEGIFRNDTNIRIPDVLTIQFGLHTCFHAHPEGYFSDHLKEVNTTFLDNHINSISKLMKTVHNAITRDNLNFTTTVIFLTSGASFIHNASNIEECIVTMNRITSDLAHDYGFAVLERGEIERRLMYKSIHSKRPFLTPDTHLSPPAQNIIATCLLKLIDCLNSTKTSIDTSLDELIGNSGQLRDPIPEARAVHSP